MIKEKQFLDLVIMAVGLVLSLFFLLLVGITVADTNEIPNTQTKQIEVPEVTEVPYQELIQEEIKSTKQITLEDEISSFSISEDDYMLAKIAMAEAEGEDIEGKVLVIQVILNRINHHEFPDTVEEVIFQSKQFTPISDGRYESVEPNVDCWQALVQAKEGPDISNGALYFTSSTERNTWHSRNLTYLFKHGNHKFYH